VINKYDRNRAIWTALESGRTVEELSSQYGLTPSRLRVVVREEGHKRCFSPEMFYRALRRP
jgi:Mor family transcriptional regulator